MTLLRGKGLGLEVVFAERDLDEALTELESRLGERPGFYRGSSATAAFGTAVPTPAQFERLRATLEGGGIALTRLCGTAPLEAIAVSSGVAYAPAVDGGQELARRRALRPKREIQLSEAAKSLDPDFAGARADIAERRKRGEASVRHVVLPHAQLSVVAPPASLPGTLYHVGTLRGGQSLHNVGNIVIVGDVNPGAELVASGDIVVFGALRGVAHAGAQGLQSAKVYALELAATQLRIATFIAAENENRRKLALVRPEAAYVKDERIVVVPLDRVEHVAT
ncbi:MAG TPA: septum site-determining protein MinC [Candidatus Baltobacteraceae bacterium]|jgi:septum site-determining protein MinC